MIRLRALALATVALALTPTAAGAKTHSTGRIDRSFSGDGAARFLPGAERVPAAVAKAPHGGIHVLTDPDWSLIRITRHGNMDHRFGDHGVARLQRDATWDGNAQPRALVVRPDGSLLVAGRITAAKVVVAAFDAHGRPLRSFGSDGRVVLDMQRYAVPAAQLLLDPKSGAITYAAARTFTYSYPSPAPDTIFFRLTADGRLDPGFGHGGIAQAPGDQLGYVGTPFRIWRTGEGGTRAALAAYDDRTGPLLTGVTATGAPDPAFGATGSSRVPGAGILLPAGSGLFDVFGRSGYALDEKVHATFAIRRLEGIPPQSTAWSYALTTTRMGPVTSVITDGRGGLYLAANAVRDPGGKRFARILGITHILAGGHIDRRFGSRGVLQLALRGRNRPLIDATLMRDPAHHRLWVAGDAGDALSSIRDDFGKDDVYLAAIRTP